MQRLRPVHRDGDAEAVRVEPVDDLLTQQRRVRRQREVDGLARLAEAPLGEGHHLADQAQVRERLAAEEDDVVGVAVRALAQQQLDRGDRRLERHLAALGRRVEVLLVAIAAGEVAARVDVQDDGRERESLDLDRRPLGSRGPPVRQDVEVKQPAQSLGQHGGVLAREARAHCRLVGPPGSGEEVEHLAIERVDLEERRRRHMEQEVAPVHRHPMRVLRLEVQVSPWGEALRCYSRSFVIARLARAISRRPGEILRSSRGMTWIGLSDTGMTPLSGSAGRSSAAR